MLGCGDDVQDRASSYARALPGAEILVAHHKKQNNSIDKVGKSEVEGGKEFDAARIRAKAIEASLRVGDFGGESGQGLFEGGGGRVGALVKVSACCGREASAILGQATLKGQKETMMARKRVRCGGPG